CPQPEDQQRRRQDLGDVDAVRKPGRKPHSSQRAGDPGDAVGQLVDTVKEHERGEAEPEDEEAGVGAWGGTGDRHGGSREWCAGELGLAARRANPTDARQTRLVLTARGRAVVRDTAPTAQERLAAGLTTLDATEREGLARALERWLEAAGLTELPATMFFEDDHAPSRPAS